MIMFEEFALFSIAYRYALFIMNKKSTKAHKGLSS